MMVTRAESGDEIETMDSYARPSVPNASSLYGSPSEACVIIELVVFRGLFMIDLILYIYMKL